MKIEITSINDENLQGYLQKLSQVFKVETINIDDHIHHTIELNSLSDLAIVMSIVDASVLLENDHLYFPLALVVCDDYMD